MPAPENLPEQLTAEYEVGHSIGSGSYGVVFNGRHKETGVRSAIKIYESNSAKVQAEAVFMSCFEHPNIVRYYGFVGIDRFACLMMECLVGGDLVEGLKRRMNGSEVFPCSNFIHIAAQISSAVIFLHARNIVHRDVKTDNFMIDRNDILDPLCRVALGDFGEACAFNEAERLKDAVGTKMFWSPEFYDLSYGNKVDIWAAGVVMYSLLTFRYPFRDELDVRKREPMYPKRLQPSCRHWLRSTLRKSEARRLTAEEMLDHPWLSTCLATRATWAPQAPPTEEPGTPCCGHSSSVSTAVGESPALSDMSVSTVERDVDDAWLY